ncbi:MAG: glycosyltransferase [Desulfovibrionaceae bacterium]|nr:glycosyltransferase [Desulfovibrionaceae bacterium]
MTQEATEPGRTASGSAPLPRVAVILLWYPLFTQPFIFRDVEGLKARLPVEVHTLYGLNLRLCSQEMRDAAQDARRLGLRALPRILGSAVRLLVTHPRRFCRLFADNVCRGWPSLEVLGENLWAFLCGVHLAPILAASGIDCTYAPWPRGTTTAARTIMQLAGIPYVTTVRGNNLAPADPDLGDKMRDAALVRTNNRADMKRILAMTPSARVEVIYNCLTLHVDSLSPVALNGPARLLAAGRFDVTKGFDVLMRACAILRDRSVPFHLTLVGGGGKMMGLGGMGGSIHDLCRELGLEEHVSFPGLVSHDAFPDILRAHDIFVAPCVVAPDGQCDGIPNTLIEAMSFGLPVVASDVNAIPEIVRSQETGLLVPQRDAEALADAIMTLVSSPETARRYGANAAALARELFSPEHNGSLLADLFIREHACRGNNQCAE